MNETYSARFMQDVTKPPTMFNAFDEPCLEANRFIEDLSLRLGTPHDPQHAIRVLTAVFRALRRKIIPDDSLHIISQLPLILKGLYVDGWEINEPLSEAKSFDGFLYDIRNDPQTEDGDFDDDEEARKKITTVCKALKAFISYRVFIDVRDELPREIAEMV